MSEEAIKKLKPCPFCGSGITEIVRFGRGEGSVYLADGKWGLSHIGEVGCPVGGVHYYHSRHQAIAAWNRRTRS